MIEGAFIALQGVIILESRYISAEGEDELVPVCMPLIKFLRLAKQNRPSDLSAVGASRS
jgi:hypothetical protein